MQWISLALVVVLSGATILFHRPRFIMFEPSIVRLSIAAVMLRRGWMRRYLSPIAQRRIGQPMMGKAGYAWAALLASIALANVFVALDSASRHGLGRSRSVRSAQGGGVRPAIVIFRAIITRQIAVATTAAAPPPREADASAAP